MKEKKKRKHDEKDKIMNNFTAMVKQKKFLVKIDFYQDKLH